MVYAAEEIYLKVSDIKLKNPGKYQDFNETILDLF